MSKIVIETRTVFYESEKVFGWAYRITKGRRQYQDSGKFSQLNSNLEAEILVFDKMCSFMHDKVQFDENTKVTIISQCRELIRLMRYGNLSEVGEITNGEVFKAFERLLGFRNTKARCVYKFISYNRKEALDHELTMLTENAVKDKKKDGANKNCSARR